MKRRSRPHLILLLFNATNTSLGLYLVLRSLIGSRWWWLGLLHTFAFWLFLPLIAIAIMAWGIGRKRTALLSMLLFAWGMIQFAPIPIGMLTASDDPHDLRVITFNVWKDNQQIDRAVDWLLAQDADVIILQEFVTQHIASLPRILEQYPYHADVEGNVRIVSRYPILEDEWVVLGEPPALRDGRLAVRAVVDLNGQPVAIYGVHLSVPLRIESRINTGFSALDELLSYDETARNNQLRTLADLALSEPHPMIIAGDFNTSHTSPELAAFEQAGLTDAYRAVGTGWGMTWMFDPPTVPILRIDYLWSSQHLTPLRYVRGDFVGSDHLPVVVDYRFAE